MDVKPANICVAGAQGFVLVDLGSVAPFGEATATTAPYVAADFPGAEALHTRGFFIGVHQLPVPAADIDKLVPSLMGVSKAVLENVIFVHQEESNWPLLEGSKLKERFDQIFESSRYAKALEDIRKLRKEKAAAQKEAEHALALAEVNLGVLKGLRRKIKEAEEAQAAVEGELGGVGGRLARASALRSACAAAQAALAQRRAALTELSARRAAAAKELAALEGELRRACSASSGGSWQPSFPKGWLYETGHFLGPQNCGRPSTLGWLPSPSCPEPWPPETWPWPAQPGAGRSAGGSAQPSPAA
jgi:hypothetical protein